MANRAIRAALLGIGSIGRPLLRILMEKRQALFYHYGLQVHLVGASDSGGAALDPDGLDLQAILDVKEAGKSVAELTGPGRPGMGARELVLSVDADLLLDASPTNLVDGQPGLGAAEAAIEQGMDLVFANKGPLVLAYPRLMHLCRQHGGSIRHSAAVAAACPAVNVGQRDLVACDISTLEGVFNMTTSYILGQMAEKGTSFQEALAEAQRVGIAEADPTLDIDGWDSANKLVILANSVLGVPATLSDVSVKGIREVSMDVVQAANALGGAIKLVSRARREGDAYRLEVGPEQLEASHPLARLASHQLGIAYATDIQGTIVAIAGEQGTIPTAAAMLRDVIDIYRP